jgi:hypothetical protein
VIKITIFWDAIAVFQRDTLPPFIGYRGDGGSKFLQNVVAHLPIYTVSYYHVYE